MNEVMLARDACAPLGASAAAAAAVMATDRSDIELMVLLWWCGGPAGHNASVNG